MVQITFEIIKAQVVTTMTCPREEAIEAVREIAEDGVVLSIKEV